MAEVYEGVICPLCREKMDIQKNLFATSGVFFPPEHRLFKFCDAAMHWDCYERWPDRAEFASAYFQAEIDAQQNNEYWATVLLSEDVFVSVGLVADEVAVFLAETGSEIRVPTRLWNLWLRSKWIALLNRPPMEKRSLSKIWTVLKTALPNARVLTEKTKQASN